MEYKFSGQINFDEFMQFHQCNIRYVLNSIWPKKSKYLIIIGIILYFTLSIFKKKVPIEEVLEEIIIMIIILSIIFSCIFIYILLQKIICKII